MILKYSLPPYSFFPPSWPKPWLMIPTTLQSYLSKSECFIVVWFCISLKHNSEWDFESLLFFLQWKIACPSTFDCCIIFAIFVFKSNAYKRRFHPQCFPFILTEVSFPTSSICLLLMVLVISCLALKAREGIVEETLLL